MLTSFAEISYERVECTRIFIAAWHPGVNMEAVERMHFPKGTAPELIFRHAQFHRRDIEKRRPVNVMTERRVIGRE